MEVKALSAFKPLTPSQKNKLNNAIQQIVEKSDVYRNMYSHLVALGVKITFEINPDKFGPYGGIARYINGTMTFYDAEFIDVSIITEEFIHAIQEFDTFGTENMLAARKNIEFEAKVIRDIIDSSNGYAGNIGQSDAFQKGYRNWISNIREHGAPAAVIRFNEFCNSWIQAIGQYDPNFVPETIVKYF